MKPTSLTFISLFILLLSISCQKKKTREPVNADIIITLSENLDSISRTLTLKCITDGDFPCVNYDIIHNYGKIGNNMALEFTGFLEPEVCFTATGPARAYIELGALIDGNYPFDISLNNHTNSGVLTVTDDSYALIFDTPKRLIFPQPILNRVPENTIWGKINYTAEYNLELAQGFIDSLFSLGAVEQLYNPGDYTPFKIDPDGGIRQYQTDGYYLQYYIYHYSGNSTDLENLVNFYELTYPDSMYISLETAKGERF